MACHLGVGSCDGVERNDHIWTRVITESGMVVWDMILNNTSCFTAQTHRENQTNLLVQCPWYYFLQPCYSLERT